MKTGLEKLKEVMRNGVKSLDEFPDMGFKRGYESCSGIVLIKIDELIEEEQTSISEQWISVKDNPPKIEREIGFTSVFVWCKIWGIYCATISYIDGTNATEWKDWNGKHVLPPTHYMPLPPPPTK